MWWFIAVLALALIGSFALRSKSQGQKPLGLDEFDVPTAEIGREIPVLFGTRKMKGPNVTWYGHLRTVAIKSKGGKK